MEASGYMYQYYEKTSSGRNRSTSLSLHNNWNDYKDELNHLDHLMSRKIERYFIGKRALYTKEDFMDLIVTGFISDEY